MTFAGAVAALLVVLDVVLVLAWVELIAAAWRELRRPGRRPGTDRAASAG